MVVEHLQLGLFELFLQLLNLASEHIGMLHHLLNKRRGWLFRRVFHRLGTGLRFLPDTSNHLVTVERVSTWYLLIADSIVWRPKSISSTI